MHRKLWADHVHTAADALQSVHGIILKILERELAGFMPQTQGDRQPGAPGLRIVDVGCGVGETMFQLATHMDAEFTGITLSPLQVQIARERAVERALEKRCIFHAADILDFHTERRFHGAIALESFSHMANSMGFFEQASRLLERNAVLVLIDDVKIEGCEQSSKALRWIDRFEKGWHLHGLCTAGYIRSCAHSTGFEMVENRDLTPFIRIRPLLLLLLRPVLAVPLPWFYRDNLRGGISLQVCTHRGFTQYRCMVFKRN
jgi:SAM-dependent methyltransferase